MAPGVTRSQVKKAGSTLRRLLRGEIKIEDPRIDHALSVIQEYRAAHQYPLVKANMGLRSAVRAEHCQVEVTQRLKRLRTIVDKLRREPTMSLTTMQDVGGCRAVLNSIDEIRRVERRLKKNRPVLGYYDYVTTPRASGYRSVHIIVGYHDREDELRAVEVQLRTRPMHDWAIGVESLSGRLQVDLKSGEGPREVLDLLAALSEAMALQDLGQEVPEALRDRVRLLRPAALPYIGDQL